MNLEIGIGIDSEPSSSIRRTNKNGSSASMYDSPMSPPSGVTNHDRMSGEKFDLLVHYLTAATVFAFFLNLIGVSGYAKYYIAFALLVSLFGFLLCKYLSSWILSREDGTPQMKLISDAIKEGAEGFLSVQYSAIFKVSMVVAGALFVIYLFRASMSPSLNRPTLALLTSISFLLGALCSALAGYTGVWASVRVNIRVASAAACYNYIGAMLLAFRGGAVASILSANLCMLGVALLYVICYIVFVQLLDLPATQVPMLLAGYGFGASFVALFMQLGGGIYTKAADVGADMVGKIDLNIPEDDPRNPAVIADLVGDNVGDCSGSMADVFESIAAEIIGTMILGGTLAVEGRVESPESFVFFPLVIHAFDLIVSAVGILVVKPSSENEDPMASMKRGYVVTMILAVIAFGFSCRLMLYTEVAPNAWWNFALCGLVGILTSYALILSTQYYTDYSHSPVQRIVQASATGHATNIIAGFSVGMESTGPPILVISISLLTSYYLGATSGLPGTAAGVYGTAIATMGMLCTAVYVLSMNNLGPIADNAGGIVEMSHQPAAVRTITDRLDSVGNVTKAASKGYAIGGSALACFVLFQAYLDEVSAFAGVPFHSVDIGKIEVITGGLIGIALIFSFTGWTVACVGRTAQEVVWEVRRQWKANNGFSDGTRPDYNQCVTIVTRAALREMGKPALLALATPCVVGLTMRVVAQYTSRPLLAVEVVASFLLFASLTGLLMAIFLDNSGGSWDNSKKYIEANGGKGSDSHKAAVTGDTVGDPFKDTAGPALHVIITTMSTTILVLGPIFLGS
eukprot:TRINITY_DN5244_c0_g1_i4.p1 TRINITY_DN5244_c0_g1~~TRINITY_DN5244_c0_g1_i4.p1  ORF type:complete len:800 (+),score=216.97 TRINITY_DN5244_c0_g1_i4:143-2542(+)